jgi:hypothetical protein
VETVIDRRLEREVEAFRLRFTCEHCAHYEVDTSACANGYPAAPHRDSSLAHRRRLSFCKEFELA